MRDCIRWAETGALTPRRCAKILALGLDIGECVRIAKAYGVPLASGTDYIKREQHGRNLEELALMRQAGLTPRRRCSSTVGGAQLCGVADEYGRIAPGYVFDAIVLDEDPGDLSVFLEPGAVTGVFKGGVPAVPHARLAEPVGAGA